MRVVARTHARERACERARYGAQAVARTDCVLLSLRKADLDELLRGEQVGSTWPVVEPLVPVVPLVPAVPSDHQSRSTYP
jgi:hypothetical protein